jgi:hypothetical protein
MRIGKGVLFVSLVALWAVAASQTISTLPGQAPPGKQAAPVTQTPQEPSLPEGHPAVAAPNRLEAASELTERIAGAQSQGQARAAVEPARAVPGKNLIDEYIFGRMEREGIPAAPLASDEEFIRRLYLDLTGRIPDGDAVEKFLTDPTSDKRERLIDRLVGSPEHAAKLAHAFVDMTRPLGGTVGMKAVNIFYDYMYDAFLSNRPYDELVRELISSTAYSSFYNAPATYLAPKFVLAPINSMVMHEDSADEMTIAVFRDFMGLNLQCISCHDGARHLEKVNLYLTERKRRDFWSQAAFFGQTRLDRRMSRRLNEEGRWVWVAGNDEYKVHDAAPGYSLEAPSQVRLARRGKGMAEPVFILTGEKPQPGKPLRQELARMMTAHPQFARATVNRVWAELMGAGLVEPLYDFDLLRQDDEGALPAGFDVQPAFPDLLDALATDFATRQTGRMEIIHQGGHKEEIDVTTTFDLQALIKMICNSRAYQLSAKFPGEWKASYAKYYARRFVRRLSAEQVYDSMVQATGRATEIPLAGLPQRARYMTQIRTPENISSVTRAPADLRPFLTELQFFLESFGASNRRTTESTTATSMTQAVLLLNSPIVKAQIQVSNDSYLGKLLASGKSNNEQLVDKLFLQFLSRKPTAAERTQAVELLARRGPKQGGEDLQWALLNKLEFIFNQ